MRDNPSYLRLALMLVLFGVAATLPAPAQEQLRLDEVLDRIVERERNLSRTIQQYRPLVETYLQTVKPDVELGTVPVRDRYFLGRLEFSEDAPAAKGKTRSRSKDKLFNLVNDFYSAAFKRDGFGQVMILDRDAFDREHYAFEFVRREFLGEVRTLVFDVVPNNASKSKLPGRFTGRIWVEDRDYNIVRFNGIYGSILGTNVHFDSWRLNLAPGLWLPAYVYTEESEQTTKKVTLKHKGQTRIWGYEVNRRSSGEEFTQVLVDAPLTRDRSDSPGQISPVESLRAWEREAEENVLRRLQKAGLLAPEGEVDQVLATVVANLEVTNSLDIQPPVRCRVLLTTPLESFTIGHTIVVSRGLIDVLPDEASLAMVLAHELGHILSGHRLDTKYAFSDQMLVGDREAMKEFFFQRDPNEEIEADDRAVALLKNSPYKDKLGNAGLFLKALAARSETLPTLIRPHFGNRMAYKDELFRMVQIIESAPELDPAALEQIAALPLGGRVKVDPWSARIELMQNNRVALLSAREKLPFLVTPLMPYLARHGAVREPGPQQVAQERAEEGDATVEPAVSDSPSPSTEAGETSTNGNLAPADPRDPSPEQTEDEDPVAEERDS